MSITTAPTAFLPGNPTTQPTTFLPPPSEDTSPSPTATIMNATRYWMIALIYFVISTISFIYFLILIYTMPRLRKWSTSAPCFGYLLSILSIVVLTVRLLEELGYRSTCLMVGTWAGFIGTALWFCERWVHLKSSSRQQALGATQDNSRTESGNGAVELGRVTASSDLRPQQQRQDSAPASTATPATTSPLYEPSAVSAYLPQQGRRDSVSAAASNTTLPVYMPMEPSTPAYSSRSDSPPPKYVADNCV